MADRRAKLPLNAKAVATANKQLWDKFPELKGRKLTMTSADASYRKFWMDAYLASITPLPVSLPTVPVSAATAPTAPSAPIVAPCVPSLTYKKSAKGGTTEVAVDDKNKTIFIRTTMEFCGPDTSEDYAKAAKKQIEDTWSGNMRRGKEDYKVVVTVTTTVKKKCSGSKDADQIIVDKSTNRMDQTLYGAGPGHQTPAAAKDAGRPRRIAHEYGHTLGLEDGYEDTPEGSKPKDPSKKNDIMSETWPDKDGKLPYPHQDHYDQVLKNYGW